MGRILPTSSDTSEYKKEGEPRLIGVDSEDADDVFSALSSDTSRKILSELYEEPKTPSDIADSIDTSLQNARYHLGKLEDAGLVEVVDQWYSSKGKEMNVYGPASGAVLVFAGEEDNTSKLEDAVTSMMSAFAVLAAASLIIQMALTKTSVTDFIPSVGLGSGGSGASAGSADMSGGADGAAPQPDGGNSGDGGDGAAPETDQRMKKQEETGDAAAGGQDSSGDTKEGDSSEAGDAGDGADTRDSDGGDGGDGGKSGDDAGNGGDGGGDGSNTGEGGDGREVVEFSGENKTSQGSEEFNMSPTDKDVELDNGTEFLNSTDMGRSENMTSEAMDGAADNAGELAEMIPPGLLFFAGGALIIAVGFVWYYRRKKELPI